VKIQIGKYEDQIDIIPSIAMYIHWNWDYEKDIKYRHFHFSVQWIIWYFEIQIGKD
jgi:hypothetical protein